VYSRRVGDKILSFGTSGLLYRSNKLMYDRGTSSLWRQFTGEPVVGNLADSGIRLKLLPVTLTTWREWANAHPNTNVLDVKTGVYPARVYLPESDPNAIYHRYFKDPNTMFPVPQRSNLLKTKDIVLGVKIDAEAKAYPLEELRKQQIINDSLAGKALIVITKPEAGAARAYERGSYRFALATGDGDEKYTFLEDQDGQRWRVEEDALIKIGDPSRRFPRISTHMAFWFGWFNFYPFTKVYGLETK